MYPTDFDVLRLIRKRRRPFDDADIQLEPSNDQLKRSRCVTGYVKALGDQQLITGFAILIAGLASRCQISFYEFNIVTSLAYFAAFTHLVSLHVLKEYMYEHKTARTWHVVFTVAFLGMFSIAYVVNTVSDSLDTLVTEDSLNPGNALQCAFEASRMGKKIEFDYLDSTLVLGLIIFNHVVAVGNLYVPPQEDLGTKIGFKVIAKAIRKTGLTQEEREAMVYNASAKHAAWLRPPREEGSKARISVWHYIESYHEAELAVIPFIVGGLGYGMTRIVLAVWYGGLKPSAGLQTFGFGQVVAVGLLALTLLSATEIANGMACPRFA